MENNLNELNEILFETLRGVKDGNVDEQRANSITNVANSIINNAKTQLSAYKLSKGKAYKENFGSLSTGKPNSKDLYEQKSEFALHAGYKNVTHAMEKMGTSQFEKEFQEWIK